jgi:hypothetical protein
MHFVFGAWKDNNTAASIEHAIQINMMFLFDWSTEMYFQRLLIGYQVLNFLKETQTNY